MKRSHAVPKNYNPTCTKVPWNGKRSSLKHSSNSNKHEDATFTYWLESCGIIKYVIHSVYINVYTQVVYLIKKSIIFRLRKVPMCARNDVLMETS